MSRNDNKHISYHQSYKLPTLTPKNNEKKIIINTSQKSRQVTQRKKTFNLLGHEVVPLDEKRICGLIGQNLSKYANSTVIYYRQIINNIFSQKSSLHCYYNEMLLEIEDEELLNKFYPRKKSVDKLKFIGIIFKNFLKYYPSYIGMEMKIYLLMNKLLMEKQLLINKIDDNMKKIDDIKNNSYIHSFLNDNDLKDDVRVKKNVKIHCIEDNNDKEESEDSKFCKELQKIVSKIDNAKKDKDDNEINNNKPKENIKKKEKKKTELIFKKRNSKKRFTSAISKTQENEMEKILRRIRLNNQLLKLKKNKYENEEDKKDNNSKENEKKLINGLKLINENEDLNINDNDNENELIEHKNDFLFLPKQKFKSTSTFLRNNRRKKRNFEEAEKVFNDILSNPVKSIIHFKEIKEKLNKTNDKKKIHSFIGEKKKFKIQNMKMPYILSPNQINKNQKIMIISDNSLMKYSPQIVNKRTNKVKKNFSDIERDSKNSHTYYYSSLMNCDEYEHIKNNIPNNFLFKSVDSVDTNFSNSTSNKLYSPVYNRNYSNKTFGNFNTYKKDIIKKKGRFVNINNGKKKYVHNVELLSLIKIE